jgi:hypothetical protein
VINAVLDSEGAGSATPPGYLSPRRSLPVRPGTEAPITKIEAMEGSEGFNLFGGDPDELRERLGELAEQMQGAQRVAWADNAIKLAVDMTVAAINRLDLAGGSDEQAVQVRDAIRIVFPEAVTLVREAREGLS